MRPRIMIARNDNLISISRRFLIPSTSSWQTRYIRYKHELDIIAIYLQLIHCVRGFIVCRGVCRAAAAARTRKAAVGARTLAPAGA